MSTKARRPPLVSWSQRLPRTWELLVHEEAASRVVATVWSNGCLWQTWDHDGTGGKNGVETNLERAKIEAAAAAIAQGFI